MESDLKKPKKGAGARLRDFYNKNIRKQLMTAELKEILKKQESPASSSKDDSNKKVAKPPLDVDLT